MSKHAKIIILKRLHESNCRAYCSAYSTSDLEHCELCRLSRKEIEQMELEILVKEECEYLKRAANE